jgi:hypothetical protein
LHHVERFGIIGFITAQISSLPKPSFASLRLRGEIF